MLLLGDFSQNDFEYIFNKHGFLSLEEVKPNPLSFFSRYTKYVWYFLFIKIWSDFKVYKLFVLLYFILCINFDYFK